MSHTYKPFACGEPGCGQSFASEDRLNAHAISHESLTELLTIPSCVVDQTPTPTRFLRNCDEIGLFQEINPFDKDFKKAVDQQNATPDATAPIPFVIQQASADDDLEVLATSSSFFTSPSDDHLQSSCSITDFGDVTASDDITSHDVIVSRDDAFGSDLTTTSTLSPSLMAVDVTSSAMTNITSTVLNAPSTVSATVGNNLLVQVLVQLQPGISVPINLPANVILPAISNMLPGSLTETSINPQLLTGPSVLSSNLPSSAADPISRHLSTVHAAPPQVNTSTIVRQLPGTTPVSRSSCLTGRSSADHGECGLTALGIAASTREKLKAAVQTMQQRPSVSQVSNVGPSAVKIPRLSPILISSNKTEALDLSKVRLQAADTSTHLQATSSKSSSDDDSSDKRKRFLESNRAAATRCRQKKKERVTNLEAKANDLEKTNQRLEKETRALKHEIHQLKLLLLEHKDCPAMTAAHYQLVTNTDYQQT